ncbi:hypothetical protein K488DRAFT_57596 [Vararia minispora EC-137]|uniref:Uncharacterized protein n=1 Tax=Vararia minispora EC-137 TaxID=1314806 RepID=A0ACB8QAZ8_9AGAM|nr:hypothetical protein K488DRAFT_57596 [Vararia minispora EC-137]
MATVAAPPPPAAPDFTQIPVLFRRLVAPFPLRVHPACPTPSKRRITTPTLWIAPPLRTTRDRAPDLLSRDVQCLTWQAHLALAGVSRVAVRWDVDPAGALGGRLPNLQLPMRGDADGALLPAHDIAGWVVEQAGARGEWEGYRDEKARDESLAWIALLEGDVHTALALTQAAPSLLHTVLQLPPSSQHPPFETLLSPPPAPTSGLLSLLPPFGSRVPSSAILARYCDAIAALSERLGTDRWFLGSAQPTALDALAFAYLHTLLDSEDRLRVAVARRVNLVTWERRVYEQVRGAFVSADEADGPAS